MGITLRHDAAAVVPPSNQSTRKYGQSLVLQQNTQKYNQQQAGYDRLFQLGRDNMQTQAQIFRDNAQITHQTNLAKGQQAFQLDRDKQQNEWRQQQQRGADFSAARARMDAHAKDALNNPDIPPELRQKIQSLVNGKMAVLGSGFNETQQQEFLDQYNSQLAALLSEIPPAQPKAPAQPNFHTDENGNRWVESGPGKWVQVPQQEQRPTSVDDVIMENPKALDSYMANAIKVQTGDDGPLTEDKLNAARDLARKQLEKDLGLGTPTLETNPITTVTGRDAAGKNIYSPVEPNGSTAPPEMKSILEVPEAPPAAQEQPADILKRIDGRKAQAQQDLTAQPPDPGMSHSPLSLAGKQAPPAAPQDIWGDKQPSNQPAYPPSDWEQLIAGTPAADAGQPPINRDIALGPGHPDYKKPMPDDIVGTLDIARTDGRSVLKTRDGRTVLGEPRDPLKAVEEESLVQKQASGSSVPQAPTPDFGKLKASAADDADRGLVSSLQGIYGSQSPEAQSAINVILSENALPEELRAARDYLKSVGIDIEQMTAPKPTGGRRGKSK